MKTLHSADDVEGAAPAFFDSILNMLRGVRPAHFEHDEATGDLTAHVALPGGGHHPHPVGNVGLVFPPEHMDGEDAAAAREQALEAQRKAIESSQAASQAAKARAEAKSGKAKPALSGATTVAKGSHRLNR